MRPAFSVIFLTTLIGAGQGLFLALFGAELAGGVEPGSRLLIVGGLVSVALSALGLVASFFHLGRPEKAWRSAAMWRTSWLSREVIALPSFMALVAAYAFGHHLGWGATRAIGFAALAACLALFFCTAMIYACIRFLQEWASPYTVANFFLMGVASGMTLAAALAASFAPRMAVPFAWLAAGLTLVALVTRRASLARNARIRPRSTLQSAIGVNHPKVRQISQGFTGQSFNTIEFFHGKSPEGVRRIRLGFMILGFIAPIALLAFAARTGMLALLAVAFAIQYVGLAMERWYFLAQANHPQNLYYQNMS